MTGQGTIYLIGDGVIDPFFWLDDKELDLRQNLMNRGYAVHNFGTDLTKLNELINGARPQLNQVRSRSYPYSLDKSGKMFQLGLLKEHVSYNNFLKNDIDNNNNLVVLSIGGNDLKQKIIYLVFGQEYYFNSVVSTEFTNNFEKIIKEILAVNKKLILISIYLPYLGPRSSYGMYSSIAKPIMHRWHQYIVNIAQKYDIPILDLSNTLDPYNRSHYGTYDIYPSNISINCIAECIAYINQNYIGFKVYSAPQCTFANLTISESFTE